ncbi:hypothetical protein LTR53_004914 [Teratosphaeriaceae sp. CCFEE 6253]|nr:hypothetical protein LTR53_004914 [Teratosphaeriaceae sp. CCFEE 6253]
MARTTAEPLRISQVRAIAGMSGNAGCVGHRAWILQRGLALLTAHFPRYSKPLKYKQFFYVEVRSAQLKIPATDMYVEKWVARTAIDCVDCLAHNANVRCDDCKEGEQDQRPCVHNGTSRRCGGCEGVGDAAGSQEE